MTVLYDESWQDIVNRLKDDDLVSLKLLHSAAAMIEKYATALEEIEKYGKRHSGYGFTCSRMAAAALNG